MPLDCPQRPADAYYEVAAWLGERVLSKEPPVSGRVVVVQHRDDRIPTTWYLPLSRSTALIDFVRNQSHLAVVSAESYDLHIPRRA